MTMKWASNSTSFTLQRARGQVTPSLNLIKWRLYNVYNITYWGSTTTETVQLVKSALGQRLLDKSSIKPFVRKAEGLLQFANIGYRAIPGRWGHVVKKLMRASSE